MPEDMCEGAHNPRIMMGSAFQKQALKGNEEKRTSCNEAPGSRALGRVLGFLRSLVADVLVSNTEQFHESVVTHWGLEKYIFCNFVRVAKFWI